MLVVKVGGRALLANLDGILEDVARVAQGEGVVLVHGGGDLVTEYSRRLGVEPRIVTHPSGIRSRYTTMEELEVYTMVMAGLLNKRIVSRLQGMGVRSLGVTGADLGLVRGQRKKRIVILNERGRPQAIPGGYTGKITTVDSASIGKLLELAQVLVVTPLILGSEGELLNVDGDQAAMALARALRPRALLMLSDVDGVIVDGGIVRRLTPGEARELASRVGKGMNRKLLMAAEAVEAGVGAVAICSGLAGEPVAGCMESGTVIAP